MEVVNSCKKTRAQEQRVNTCHVFSGNLLKKSPSVWASEDGEGVMTAGSGNRDRSESHFLKIL